MTAFDIAYAVGMGSYPYLLCEMFQISLHMLDNFELTQNAPPILLCHSLIFRALCISFKISENSLYRFLVSTTDEKFRALKHSEKMESIKKFQIEANVAKQVIEMMQREYESLEEFGDENGLRNNPLWAEI